MAERELAILLTAKNLASGALKKVTGDLSRMDTIAGRAGRGMRTLGRNVGLLGAGAAIAGVAAIRSGLESLAERENVISATTAAIAAQGTTATVTAGQVRNWSEELERATGAAVDDKAIQASANTIIRTGAVSEAAFKRTLAAAVDLGAGLKTGPEAGAKLLGKALADPVKGMSALRKAGIVLTEAETARIKQLVKGNKVQDAQAEILAAVEKRYKGAAAASAGPYTRALNMLADVTEDAKMALAEGFLPVLTKVADKLSGALGDPKTMADIRGLGQGLAKGFDAVLDASSRIPWGSIRDAMSLAGRGAKAALDLFTGMPPWVQTAVLTGWGLNKLTGGAVGGIIGELGKGLIKGVLGMTAGVVNINAGVVNGAGGGGIPGAAGAAGGAAAGAGIGGGAAAALALAGPAIGVALGEMSRQAFEQMPSHQQIMEFRGGRTRQDAVLGREPATNKPIPVTFKGFGGRSPEERGEKRVAGEAAVQERAIAAGLRPTADQITRTYNATSARQEAASRTAVSAAQQAAFATRDGTDRIVAAIHGIRIPQPVINFTAADTVRKINRRRRTVTPTGSRDRILGGMQEF